MKKSIISIALLYASCITAGVDRQFTFDIFDATAEKAAYENSALIVPAYQTAENDLAFADGFAGTLPPLYHKAPALLKARGFKATGKEVATFTDLDDAGNLSTIIVSSLGSTKEQEISLESFRRCIARALRAAEAQGIEVVHIALPACVADSLHKKAQEVATIAHQALYEFNALKSDKKPYRIKRICVHATMQNPQAFKDVNIGLRIGDNLGVAICQARDWINTPANLMTPTILAKQSSNFIAPYISRIETVIFEKEDLARMNMGGILGVSQGSDEPCYLAVHYLKNRKPNVPTIALVGKGVTFDAGGLTIKTGVGMESMKCDMSGAAAVLSALNVLAYRNVQANIAVLTPLTENMINGSATRPGDVLTMHNGKTVEVLNTDAEGRLILADALAFGVEKFKPDYIIDIATLTGACSIAFGGCFAGIVSNNDHLAEQVKQAAAYCGESVWQMPLHEEYTKRMKSDIADLRNCPKGVRTAGMLTAASFLKEFVGDTPWLHIDMASVKQAAEYNPHGYPGFGVRLLVELVERLAQG